MTVTVGDSFLKNIYTSTNRSPGCSLAVSLPRGLVTQSKPSCLMQPEDTSDQSPEANGISIQGQLLLRKGGVQLY